MIVYKDFDQEEGRLLFDMAWLMEHYKEDCYNKGDLAGFYMTASTGSLNLQVIMGFMEISGIAICQIFWSIMKTAIVRRVRLEER